VTRWRAGAKSKLLAVKLLAVSQITSSSQPSKRKQLFGPFGFFVGQSLRSDAPHFYRIIQELGTGKSANAYLALRTSSQNAGTFCVLKLLLDPLDEIRKRRFIRERDIIMALNHDSVVRYVDRGTFHNRRSKGRGLEHPFYVCDFYSKTLSASMIDRRLKITQKLSYAIQLSSAVAYLESCGLVHCDIKPDNIYVDGLKCVLADFGLCLKAGESSKFVDLPSLHCYRTPHIVKAMQTGAPVHQKSDVFQLGLVLCELFTGRNPCIEAENGATEVRLDEIPDVYGVLGSKIKQLVEKMLVPGDEDRPAASQLIDNWQTILFDAYPRMLALDKNVF